MNLDGVLGMSGNGHSKGHNGDHKSALEEFTKKRKAAKKLADTIELHHEQAYTSAANALLKGEDNLIDYTRLNDTAVQEKMADKMADLYVAEGRKYLHIGDDTKLDEMQEEMLMRSYAGITRGELRRIIGEAGQDFHLEQFRGLSRRLKQQVENQLAPIATSHIKESDLETLVEGLGLKGKVDPTKLDLPGAHQLLEEYHANDSVVPQRAYRNKIYDMTKKADHHEPAHAGAGHH